MPTHATATKRALAKSDAATARTPVPVDGLPGQDKITSLTIVNAGQKVAVASSRSGRLEIHGHITDAEGGVYAKDEQGILIGFEGEIHLPRTIDFRLEQTAPSRRSDLVERFAPSLAGRPVAQLECPVREIKTARDLASYILWTTQPADADYYGGAYPSRDPLTLAYLEKLAGAQRFYEIQALHRHVDRGPGEDRYVRIGRAVQRVIENSKEGQEHQRKMHAGAQAAVIAPDEVMTMACAAFEHGVRADVTRETLRERIQSAEEEIRADLEREEKEEPEYWRTMAGAGGGLALSLLAVGVGVLLKRPDMALKAGASGLAATAVLLGGGAGADALANQEHDQNVVRLREKAASLHFAREALSHYDREGMFTDTVTDIIRIVGEDDERIRGEWERANSPDEKRKIIDQVKYRLDRMEQGRKAPSALVAQYLQAARAKNFQRMAGILVQISESRNTAVHAARKALGGRMDAVVGGFAKGAIPRPKDMPAWMQA